ncbi:MAG: fasciclin domain-containing protein [Cyclobacteriaceae bacterium]
MKRLLFVPLLLLLACGQQPAGTEASVADAPAEGGQSTVKDETSAPDVVRVAVNSPDHTTLVAALKGAEYVDALSNAGPFTVFAPTNEAFNKLPAGTVENLMKPESKDALRNILEYHVYVGVISEAMIQDGMTLNQVNLDNITLNKKDGKITVNGANVLGVVKASNGVVYVIDAVLLPPDKK